MEAELPQAQDDLTFQKLEDTGRASRKSGSAAALIPIPTQDQSGLRMLSRRGKPSTAKLHNKPLNSKPLE